MYSKLRISAVFIVAAVICCPINGFAYRPFATEDAGVAGLGVAQFELSWDHLKWNGDKEDMLLFVPVYGLTKKIELSAEIPYHFHNYKGEDRRDGIGDISLAGKFLLMEEKAGYPALVFKSAVKTRSGSVEKGLGSGDADYHLAAAASRTFGAVALHGMFGYTFVGDNGDESIRNIYLYGLAADYGITEKFHLTAEIAGNKHPDRTARENPLSGLLGFTQQLSEKLILDSGVRYGFNKAMPKWSTTLGVSVTF